MKKALAIAAIVVLAGSVGASANEAHKHKMHTSGVAANANKTAKATNSETHPPSTVGSDTSSTQNNPTLQSLQSK